MAAKEAKSLFEQLTADISGQPSQAVPTGDVATASCSKAARPDDRSTGSKSSGKATRASSKSATHKEAPTPSTSSVTARDVGSLMDDLKSDLASSLAEMQTVFFDALKERDDRFERLLAHLDVTTGHSTSTLGPGNDPQDISVGEAEPTGQNKADDHFYDVISAELTGVDRVGPAVSEPLVQLITDICQEQMPEDKLTALRHKHERPANIKGLTAPRVNPEIWTGLNASQRSTDLRLANIQDCVLRGMTPLIQLLNILDTQRETGDPKELVQLVGDSLRLLSQSNNSLNQQRRENLKFTIAPGYRHLCSAATPVTEYLFGDNLPSVVKSITEANNASLRLSGGFRNRRDSPSRRGGLSGSAPYRPQQTSDRRGSPYSDLRHLNYGESAYSARKKGRGKSSRR
ncbi:uncharacterized protein LOC106179464 isoform X2 [Lingula anatina]|uniref:Uncharacterized protein LOC106179464 isoform X2 n=1 Tax=Lingula anatina TaxID=7574 RepID=A0A1S3K7E1_LINAN|nr:uncharacterized protein LOC106179464 isoform X2 [Lingula anatina]|eukprot:XP_013418550.1 uncharacterized protein LOC106179464 isoform X2 [Lingula anatina]